ncbi:hypothetical protein ES702_00109 [subsurface metagenome]
MNHLPLPQNATIQRFQVPLLTTSLDYGGHFEDYSKRHGWTITLHNRVTEFQYGSQVVDDETRIGELLQSWLYFGLLMEFGFSISLDAFREKEDGVNMLTSSCLTDVFPKRLQSMRQEVKSMIESQLEDFVDHLQGCLRTAWTNLRWIVSSTDPLISSICLSIAALAEALEFLLRSALEETSASLTASVPWRIQPGYDFGLPLLTSMRLSGWCPHRLTHVDREGNDSIGRLWYLANIQPPLHDRDHSACSTEVCRHLQINSKTYLTAHSSDDCGCPFGSSDSQRLAEIVGADEIPLVCFKNGSVQILQASAETPFVAISHVWADGMGNQMDNTLPLCVLEKLQKCVNEVLSKHCTNELNVPFWIDTLCLPRLPIEMRRKGIANLSEAFKRASVVLVMDSYLRNLDSAAMSTMEIVARITVSNWTLRLWTLSEGRLGKRLFVQFRDRAVEPLVLVSVIEEVMNVFSGLPSDPVMIEMLRSYNATSITTVSDIDTLTALRSSLRTRSTSWRPDEALCLGYILDLDMAKLVEVSENEKMQTFWKLLDVVPLGIAFSDAKTKVEAQGYRWAPASLTGNLEAEYWLGPANLEDMFAVQSQHGLVVKLPTLIFNHNESSPFHTQGRSRLIHRFKPPTELLGPLEFKHENGNWYHCVIEDVWHQVPASSRHFEDSRFVILLTDVLPEYKQNSSLRGLLITYRDSDMEAQGQAISANVHFHVSINRCTNIEDHYMEYLESQAAKVDASHREQVIDVLDDRAMTFNLIWTLWVKEIAIHDRELLILARRVHQERGMNDDIASLLIYCCDYVVWFLRVGEWYKIRGGRDDLEFCID